MTPEVGEFFPPGWREKAGMQSAAALGGKGRTKPEGHYMSLKAAAPSQEGGQQLCPLHRQERLGT
jgi:hypothetical protein